MFLSYFSRGSNYITSCFNFTRNRRNSDAIFNDVRKRGFSVCTIPNTPSPPPLPTQDPTIVPPALCEEDAIEYVIDENVKKVKSGYIFSNGDILWIKGITYYIIRTGFFIEDEIEIFMVYKIQSGVPLKKRYGYFDENEEFIECELCDSSTPF